METFAFLHVAVDYEDPDLDLDVRSLNQLLSPAAVGAVAIGVAVLSQHPAQALMRYGDAGRGVSALQEQLRLRADGIYGEQTRNRVRLFQADRGIRVDGVAGPATLAALGLNTNLSADSNNSSYNNAYNNGYNNGYANVSYRQAVVTSRIGLAIRNRPDGSRVSGVDRGEQVSLTSNRQYAGGRNWVQLTQGGWIAEEYVSYGGSSGGIGGDTVADVASGPYVSSRIGLVVRDQPNGYQIGGLATGQRVALSGASSYAGGRSWLQLQSGGWVAEQYISYR